MSNYPEPRVKEFDALEEYTQDIFSCKGNVTGVQTSSRTVGENPRRILSYYERISPSIDGQRSKWNDFQHYKYWASFPQASRIWYPTSQYVTGLPNAQESYHKVVISDPLWRVQGIFSTDGFRPSDGLLPYHSDSETEVVPVPAGLGEILDAAVKRWVPIVKSGLSEVNSALELGDLLSIKGTARNVVRALFDWNFSRQLKSHPRQTIRQLLKVGSDAYLQKEFNIEPLLSDILGVHRALVTSEQRIRSLINGSGRLRKFHFNVELSDEKAEVVDVGPYTWSGNFLEPSVYGSMYTHRSSQPQSPTVHVEIAYAYSYTQFQVVHARLLAYLDAIGVNLNPAIIWNAIPWSFTIDWVLGVSRWLDQFKVTNMDPQINIYRALWSVTRKRQIAVSRSLGINDLPYVSYCSHIPVLQCTETAYRRQNFTPEMISLTTSGLSLKEISLGSALVLARKPRQKFWHVWINNSRILERRHS